MKKYLFVTLLYLGSMYAQSVDNNHYKIFLDCATTDQYFHCFEIRESLKIKLTNQDEIVSSLNESNISLKIRTREITEAAINFILVEQHFQIRGEDTPFLIETKKYRVASFNTTTVTDLVNHITVHLAKLRGVVSVAESEDGVVVVFNNNPMSSGNSGDKAQDWYVEPSGNFSSSNSVGESSTMRVGASGTFVKSQAKSKFILGTFGSFYKQKIQFENGVVEDYQEFSMGMSTYYIRSFKNNRWSVALLSNMYSSPVKDNIDFQQQLRIGIEYNLVPFITKSEDMVFVVRYSVGPDYYNFRQENISEQMSLWLLKHGITLVTTVILNKYNYNNLPLSLGFSLSGNSEVSSFRYANVNASVQLNYNVTDRVSLSPSYSFVFANTYINKPKSDNGSLIGGIKNAGQFASEKHHFNVTLNFAFGSPGLKNQDTRWSRL